MEPVLFFGRNEENGLRCVYHGWKFDAAGNCIDMPNEPAESDFKTKVKAIAYPTRERGGIIWVYMGPRAEADLPPLPDLEGNMLDEEQTGIGIFQRECNWMQALEGDIDTAHVGFLHQGAISADSVPDGSWAKYALSDRAPRFKVLDIDGGVTYGTYRPADQGNTYWRVAHFLFPFYTMVAAGVLGLKVAVRAWVPHRRQPLFRPEHVQNRHAGASARWAGREPGRRAAASQILPTGTGDSASRPMRGTTS